jgi:hypothetical protein
VRNGNNVSKVTFVEGILRCPLGTQDDGGRLRFAQDDCAARKNSNASVILRKFRKERSRRIPVSRVIIGKSCVE